VAGHDLICVGGSAGAVDASLRLAEILPRELPAAILLVIHLPAGAASNLPKLLGVRGPLPARFAVNGEPPQRGVIHVARPDRHLVLVDGVLQLSRGPHENGFRPSIDTMFRSAAIAAGARVVGVVLSGTLDDGTAGLIAVRRAGGVAVVQDPDDAPFPDMPRNAIRGAGADHVAPLDELPQLLLRLTREVAELPPPGAVRAGDGGGATTPFVCPDCGGVLNLDEESLPSFRCQVGHRWNGKGLAAKQREALELALWAALRTLKEHSRLSRALEERALARGHAKSAQRFANRARESEHRLSLVRAVLGLDAPRGRPRKRVREEARLVDRDLDAAIEDDSRTEGIDGDGGTLKG
jgi:two-component system chemotaxis response regulator CheB